MVRPLRIEYPGAYYHVINRGQRQEDIFFSYGQKTQHRPNKTKNANQQPEMISDARWF